MKASDAPNWRMSKYTLYVSSSMSSLGSAGGSQVMSTLSFVKGSTVEITAPGTPAEGGYREEVNDMVQHNRESTQLQCQLHHTQEYSGVELSATDGHHDLHIVKFRLPVPSRKTKNYVN